MTALTVSNEHYIKAICETDLDGDGARISDIAAKLDVSKASACVAMKALEQKKIVQRDVYRRVLLTPEGKNCAAFIQNKYAVIKRFLVEVLKLDERLANIDACALEHVISIETFYSMLRLVENTTENK